MTALTTTWPILSVTTFLPLVGAFHRLAEPWRRRGGAGQCALDRVVGHGGDLRRLGAAGAALRRYLKRIPVRREGVMGCRRHLLSYGCRRHLAALRDPDDGADAVLHHRQLEGDHHARARIHDGVPGAGNADDRHLLGARSRAVLPVLRRRPDPDVPDHRRVGRAAARPTPRSSSFSTRCSARC